MRGLVFLLVIIVGGCRFATGAQVLALSEAEEYALLPGCEYFCDSTNRFNLEAAVREWKAGGFVEVNAQTTIAHHQSYWLQFEVRNTMQNNLLWMLCFNAQISHVEVYTLPRGDTVDFSQRKAITSIAINNITRNKLLIPLNFKQSTQVFVHIYNKVLIEASIAHITVKPQEQFVPELSMHGFLVGLTFGGYVIMFIFSLFIWFTQKKKEFIFYSLYIVCNAIFAVFGSFVTDKYLFAANPWAAYNFHSIIIVGHIFYIIFVRLFIEPQNIPPKIDRYLFKPFIVFIVVVNTFVTALSFIDAVWFKFLLDCSLLCNACFGLLFTALLFRIRLRVVRYILLGTLVMIIAGIVGQVVDMFDLLRENYFYNIGVLIELMFFALAINYKQKLANDEKKQKEIEFATVKTELANKYRELTQKAMHLSQQEQMLNSLKSQLEEIKGESSQTNKVLLKTLSDIDMYISQNSWEDFEKYFTEVHPDYYKKLLLKYPDLSQTELRVCAMLKLGLNTKEIAAISNKTPKSIDVTRNRIRLKMSLQREDNLFSVLSQL